MAGLTCWEDFQEERREKENTNPIQGFWGTAAREAWCPGHSRGSVMGGRVNYECTATWYHWQSGGTFEVIQAATGVWGEIILHLAGLPHILCRVQWALTTKKKKKERCFYTLTSAPWGRYLPSLWPLYLKVGNSEVSREVMCSRSLKLLTLVAELSWFFSEQYLMKVNYRITTGGGLTMVPVTTEKKPFGSWCY